MARKRTGQLIPRRDGWAARITVERDGEKIRETVPLGTTNKAVARRKLARLLAGEMTPEQAKGGETLRDACERVHELRKSSGVASAKDEIASLRAYAFPVIGDRFVGDVQATDINQALDHCKELGRSRQTVQHLRQRLSSVFVQLKREGAVKANPVAEATMPTFPETVRQERAVLTDAELAAYLAYEHPQEHWRMAILERQVMACVARMFGGLRTGDLHTLEWSKFDTSSEGAFGWGWAPRRKTRRPQRLIIPAMLRPILRDWWERHSRPTSGLVFPARRGERAGETKRKVSHARAFRRDLRRAFGLERWNAELQKYEPTPDREMTPRERELFEETDYTLPVDFHSWRRAYSQALADAGVNAQAASALAGHASLSAHQRYLQNAEAAREIPEAALPRLLVSKGAVAAFSDSLVSESSLFLAERTGLEPAASGVTGALARRGEPQRSESTTGTMGAGDPSQALASPRGLLPVPFAVAADAALGAYLRAMADGLAAQLSA